MPKNKKGLEFFFVAGELGPDCATTNIILTLAHLMDKKSRPEKIIITKAPNGPGIPKEIRKGWRGAVMISKGLLTIGAKSIVDKDSRAVFVEGYVVETAVALDSLEKVSIDSWKWFSHFPSFLKKELPKYLLFNKECCKVVNH